MADSPIPILYCIDRYSDTGGTELQLQGLLQRLDRNLFDPHVCLLGCDEGDTIPSHCHSLLLDVPALGKVGTVGEARKLRDYLRQHRIRIVQSFFQDATVFSIPIARMAGVPVRLISFRDLGFWRTRRSEMLMRWTYRLATGFLANSNAVRDVVVDRDGLAPSAIEVIRNGMDVAGFEYRTAPAVPPTVAFVGNLNRRVKRPELFVEAAARIAPRHPDVRWLCIGNGHHRAELERRAEDLGLGDAFAFLGRRGDVPDLLRQATIGVNCSDSEGLANAVLEYMLAGAAVVATDVGGNRELVVSGENGLLVPPGDLAALTEGIASLLDAPATADAMRRRARDLTEREFDWTRCVSGHQDFYVEQLKARP